MNTISFPAANDHTNRQAFSSPEHEERFYYQNAKSNLQAKSRGQNFPYGKYWSCPIHEWQISQAVISLKELMENS